MVNDEILIRYFTGQATKSEQEAMKAFQETSPEEFEILRKIWTNKSQINLKSFNKEAAWQKVATATIKKKTWEFGS